MTDVDVLLATSVLVSGPLVLLGLAVLFAVGLSVANVKLRVEQDPRIDQVNATLPAANCGGCGYAGCAAFAEAVVRGEAPVNGCTVGGTGVAEAVARIMGVTFEVTVRTRPVVHCAAHTAERLGRRTYRGIDRCGEANWVAGIQGCTYGCLGFGDCVASCQFDALRMDDGLPMFDYAKCTSCGACVRACPRGLIELIPFKQESMLVVACSSEDPGKVVRQVCQVGCLGCGACARKSEVFGIDRNRSRIDYSKYEDWESLKVAFEKCPAKVLVVFGPHGRVPVKEAYARQEFSAAPPAAREVPAEPAPAGAGEADPPVSPTA